MSRVTKLHRLFGVGVVSTGLLVVPMAGEAGPAGAGDGWPSRVSATYKVAFNGLEIGGFKFTSDVSGQGYVLSSDAQLSALLGAFQWRGTSRSSGTMAAGEPKPQGYAFNFQTNSRQGAVRIGFTDTRITNVNITPPSEPQPDVVPIREHHLKDVLDPLSAVMAISRASANPCSRRLAIFDGKQRFDLIFSYRRQEKVAEQRPTGQPALAHVCRVKVVPIAGHRDTGETKKPSDQSGIEVALRPVPNANLVVPYQVTIPTFAGSATIDLVRIDITSDKGQIALAQ